MSSAKLKIDLDAVFQNWKALDSMSATTVETAAVVKADGYGLDAGRISKALSSKGVNSFFVAIAEEGIAVRKSVGPDADIYVFSGMMLTDAKTLKNYNLIPLLNAPEQMVRFRNEVPNAPFGIQLDTGMNRLGMEAEEFVPFRDHAEDAKLIISHLACADNPNHPQNSAQLSQFHAMTDGLNVKRSLAATGGTLLGSEYHFDMCRPGVGLYGGLPFADTKPVITLTIPVIQTRTVLKDETVGYSAMWKASRNSRIATIAAGYADGLIRALGNGNVSLFAGSVLCPVIGRVSMDLITVDVSHLDTVPDALELINAHQTVDDLAKAANTIGYEILTSLGGRYERSYIGE